MCGVCIYIFNMYTYILCAYICMIYSYKYAVCSWLSAKWSALITLYSCWLNLHVAHYREASSLLGATILPTSSSSQPSRKALEIYHFPFPFHQGLWEPGRPLLRKIAAPTRVEASGSRRWWDPLLARRQLWERLCSWAWWGRNLALAKVGLHNLLKFRSWNVVVS